MIKNKVFLKVWKEALVKVFSEQCGSYVKHADFTRERDPVIILTLCLDISEDSDNSA